MLIIYLHYCQSSVVLITFFQILFYRPENFVYSSAHRLIWSQNHRYVITTTRLRMAREKVSQFKAPIRHIGNTRLDKRHISFITKKPSVLSSKNLVLYSETCFYMRLKTIYAIIFQRKNFKAWKTMTNSSTNFILKFKFL